MLRWELDLAPGDGTIAVFGAVDTDPVRRYHLSPGFSREEELRSAVVSPAE